MKFPYKEKILHFIWQYQYFEHLNLQTENGEEIQILSPGFANPNEGPDFLEARIKMADVIWSGSIEIHPKAKDWEAHQHSQHNAYNQVILHVVYEKPTNDEKFTKRKDGTDIPILSLADKISTELLKNCVDLVSNISPIPCGGSISNVDKFTINNMIDKVLIQRLQSKSLAVNDLLIQNNMDWDETTYQWLAQNFGFKVNAVPFLKLAQALPLKILLKHSDQLFQIEALLFGVAGFLEEEEIDDYHTQLKKEYKFLAHKYDLNSKQLDAKEWKFLRLRPDNFPTIRMSQLAALVHQLNGILSQFLQTEDIQSLKKLLDTQVSEYWQTHFVFGKKSEKKSGTLGNVGKENILINTVAILWVAYFVHKGETDWMDRVSQLLENIAPENNKITRLWTELQIENKNAYQSQGLIELYNQFCLKRNCLNCSIGYKIIHAKALKK